MIWRIACKLFTEMRADLYADSMSCRCNLQSGVRWIAVLLFAIIPFLPAAAQVNAGGSRLAPTPPMGWANWNSLACNYDETTIRAMADRMVSSGMKDAGYNYLIIQECIVPTGHRDANGT